MKNRIILTGLLVSMFFLVGCEKANAQETATAELSVGAESTEVAAATTADNVAGNDTIAEHGHDMEKIIKEFSYVYGALMASSFTSIGILPDMDQFTTGFLSAYHGEELEYDELAQQQIIAEFNHIVEDLMTAQASVAAQEGADFLANKALEEGVIIADSGLLYRIIEPGSDKKPTEEDTVTVHYRGTFIDGSEFDSSYSRGTPTSFPLNGVIAGWTEGLQYIGEGGSIELFIPSDLAYGQGTATIPANSVLVFEVELISIDSE